MRILLALKPKRPTGSDHVTRWVPAISFTSNSNSISGQDELNMNLPHAHNASVALLQVDNRLQWCWKQLY